MKLNEAISLIREFEDSGYYVSFERKDGSVLLSDYVPDLGDKHNAFETEEDAWIFAERLAGATVGKFVNFYVVDIHANPTKDYDLRRIRNRAFCGHDYFINEGSSPLEKGWDYCPFCGLKIKEK